MDQTTTVLICVNYRTPEVTRQFVAHVLSQVPTPHIVIADNDGSLGTDGFHDARVSVYQHPRNPGYLGGCRLAFEQWLSTQSALPRWVGIVNTDLVFDEDFFRLLELLPAEEQTGVVAPDIRLPSGRAQNPYLLARLPAGKVAFLYRLFRHPLLFALWDAAHYLKHKFTHAGQATATAAAGADAQPIYAPCGAAMFFSRSFFQKGGHLHYRGFLYQEEIFIAEQLRALGQQCQYLPALKLTHHESTTINTIGLAQKCRYKHDSIKVIIEDYYPEIRLKREE